jgi:hypothetical protein
MVGSSSGSEKEGENRQADEESRSVLLLQLTIKRGQISRLTIVFEGSRRGKPDGGEGGEKGCLISSRGSGAEWKSGDVQDKAAPATV